MDVDVRFFNIILMDTLAFTVHNALYLLRRIFPLSDSKDQNRTRFLFLGLKVVK